MPASTWGHCPQVLCFTTVWDTPGKGKVAKWSSAPASILRGFSEIYAVYGPKKPCKTQGKCQSCQIDPCLPPYTPPPTPIGGTKDDRAAKWHVVAQMRVEDAPVASVHTTSADTILVTGGVQTSCPRRAPLGITLPRGGLGRPGVRLGVSTGTTH